MGCIYLLTFPNGKLYVGQTKRPPAVRFRAHRAALKADVKSPIYHAWRKHGEPTMTLLLDGVDVPELDEAERICIRALQTRSRKIGYNATEGGDEVYDRTGSPAHNRGVAYAARAAGLTIYVSTRPCPKGHIGQRYAKSSACVECAMQNNHSPQAAARKKKWRDSNPEKQQEYAQRPTVAARRRAWAAQYRATHREEIREYHREYQRAYRARS